jgi:hypothetical protein
MTTWHDDEPLDEALDFFVSLSCPTAGFERNNNFWIAMSLNNAEWAVQIQQHLEEANLPIRALAAHCPVMRLSGTCRVQFWKRIYSSSMKACASYFTPGRAILSSKEMAEGCSRSEH